MQFIHEVDSKVKHPTEFEDPTEKMSCADFRKEGFTVSFATVIDMGNGVALILNHRKGVGSIWHPVHYDAVEE